MNMKKHIVHEQICGMWGGAMGCVKRKAMIVSSRTRWQLMGENALYSVFLNSLTPFYSYSAVHPQVHTRSRVQCGSSASRVRVMFECVNQPRIQDLAKGGAVLQEGRHIDNECMRSQERIRKAGGGGGVLSVLGPIRKAGGGGGGVLSTAKKRVESKFDLRDQ